MAKVHDFLGGNMFKEIKSPSVGDAQSQDRGAAVTSALQVIEAGRHLGQGRELDAISAGTLMSIASLPDWRGSFAASELGSRRDPAALPTLLARIQMDPDGSIFHLNAIKQIAIGDDSAIKVLGSVCESANFPARVAAAEALIVIGTPAAINCLKAVAEGARAEVLESVCAAINTTPGLAQGLGSLNGAIRGAYDRLPYKLKTEVSGVQMALLLTESETNREIQNSKPGFISGPRDTVSHPPALGSLFMNTALPWDTERGDIVLRREPVPGNQQQSRVACNVAWTAHTGAIGFQWGSGGSGPSELAINILNQIVPPSTDGFPPVKSRSPSWDQTLEPSTSATAHALTESFKAEFLTQIPPEGGVISGEKIRNWIGRQRKVVENAVAYREEIARLRKVAKDLQFDSRDDRSGPE
jgi:hypothetical protein